MTAGINMRLDYTLYILAAALLIMTVVPFIAPIGMETTETQSLWVISTVFLGLLSIGLGYSQKPKTEAQSCQAAVTAAQETMPRAQPAETLGIPEEAVITPAKAATKKAAPVATPAITAAALTQVKGIGEKRALQLKALGINTVEDLSKASAATVAKKLKISLKIVDNWVANAKNLVK
jgi:predicted flap endonuclease-1-like 5' DNA nuclease